MTEDIKKMLVKIYFFYALAIGITSHRFVNNTFQTSKFSRVYSLVFNVVTILLLPVVIWDTAAIFQAQMDHQAPVLLVITYYVRCAVAYLVILYTILTRGFRDRAYMEMQPLLFKLMREEKRYGIKKKSRSLMGLFYLKFAAATWCCTTDSIYLFHSSDAWNWMNIIRFIFLSSAYNILEVVPMAYFLGLWHIARGYDCVNQRLEKLGKSLAKSKRDREELKHLWSLHAELTRTAREINKIYSPQMLAFRFDCFVYGVIQAYWGAFFVFGVTTPIFWVIYGSVAYYIRSLDYYLIDHMCDLLVKYQNSSKHLWKVKSHWTKETSAFVIYANSLKLELWTCGLYQANRSLWFDMMSNVFYYFTMLLQFHLVMGK